jgi:hypothetical protein
MALDLLTAITKAIKGPKYKKTVKEFRSKIYKIQDNATTPEISESILANSNFSYNKTAVIIWLTLAMTSALYLVLFLIAFAMCIKHCKNNSTFANFQNLDPKH